MKHKYYVTYTFIRNGQVGYGNDGYVTNYKCNTFEAIKKLTDYVSKKISSDELIITNLIKLRK